MRLSDVFFLNSANLIFRGTDISKYFRETLDHRGIEIVYKWCGCTKNLLPVSQTFIRFSRPYTKLSVIKYKKIFYTVIIIPLSVPTDHSETPMSVVGPIVVLFMVIMCPGSRIVFFLSFADFLHRCGTTLMRTEHIFENLELHQNLGRGVVRVRLRASKTGRSKEVPLLHFFLVVRGWFLCLL